MSWTQDLLVGIAERLATTGVGTWRPSAPYVPSDARPIFLAATPASPDEVLTLADYGVSDDLTQADSVIGVQVRTRAVSPAAVRALDDAVFEQMHGLSSVVLNGVTVLFVARQSAAPLGTDDNRRHEHVSNYYVTAHRPSTHRPD